MTTSTSSNSPRIKLRGNGHATTQKNKSPSTAVTKSTRPILRTPDNSRLIKGTAPLPGAGAPLGSQNSRNGRLVKEAIIRALRKRSRSDMLEELEAVAVTMIKLAKKGHVPAARELFDRIDGKPAQMLVGDPENPLQFNDQTQLTNSARVTRLLQVLALQNPSDAKAAFAVLKAKVITKVTKKK